MNRTLALLAFVLATAPAYAGERTAVTSIKPLLIAALKHGSARGVIAGAPAAYVRQRFDTEAPIEVDVKRVHALPKPGCSRLEIITRQLAVSENGKREDKELVYQVSYCWDGTFPERR